MDTNAASFKETESWSSAYPHNTFPIKTRAVHHGVYQSKNPELLSYSVKPETKPSTIHFVLQDKQGKTVKDLMKVI